MPQEAKTEKSNESEGLPLRNPLGFLVELNLKGLTPFNEFF
jgi:hypothetical protein